MDYLFISWPGPVSHTNSPTSWTFSIFNRCPAVFDQTIHNLLQTTIVAPNVFHMTIGHKRHPDDDNPSDDEDHWHSTAIRRHPRQSRVIFKLQAADPVTGPPFHPVVEFPFGGLQNTILRSRPVHLVATTGDFEWDQYISESKTSVKFANVNLLIFILTIIPIIPIPIAITIAITIALTIAIAITIAITIVINIAIILLFSILNCSVL